MRKSKALLFCAIFLFGFSSVYAQLTDIGPDTKVNVPGNHGMTEMEKNNLKIESTTPVVPEDLMQKYIAAKNSRDENEKARLGQEIDQYLNAYPTINNGDAKIKRPEQHILPFEPDWGIGDYTVHIGDVAYTGGFRQMDMKLGEDGNLYIAINRRNVTGYSGYISVYTSTNGGKNWTWVSGTVSAASYFGQISMLVEKRHATNDDSTRIILYYTVSSASNQNDASLYYCSFLRNGAAGSWYSGQVATPTSGNKLQYPSACSDGMYYGTATYLHVVVQEVTNANVHYRVHHYRSTSWGTTHTAGIINTTWNDFYPSAGFSREVLTSSDSIYVAVERRFDATNAALRLLILPETPSAVYTTYYLAGGVSPAKYEKPCITIQQENATTQRKVLVTSTKDSAGSRTARYHGSTNSGSTWNINYNLGSTTMQTDFTSCSSDSTTAGGGYFIAAFVNVNGDSITLRRGIIGDMGTYLYKRNAHYGTGTLPPMVAIYKEGGVKYSALAYAGSGPTSVFFNQENLPAVGVTPISSNVPDKFTLSQNYPNPFNPSTIIHFGIPGNGMVKLTVYDILGREVNVLVNEFKNAGSYQVDFNASLLTSGLYFYKLESGSFVDTKKMLLIK